MSCDTSPLALARNGYVWTTLQSWISPAWFAGTWVAVTVTVPPGATRVGFTVSVVAWATTAHTPRTRSRIRTAAMPSSSLRRLRFGVAAGGVTVATGGDGYSMATVAGWAGRSATAVLAIGFVAIAGPTCPPVTCSGAM